MRRSPAVVDRKAIAEHAWADETDPLGSNAIDVQLSRLRAKLPERRDPDRHGSRRRLPARGGMTVTAAALPSVRRVSIRVALARDGGRRASPTSRSRRRSSSIVQRNLTDQIDQRITRIVRPRVARRPQPGRPARTRRRRRTGSAARRSGLWPVDSDGTVHTDSRRTRPCRPTYTGGPRTGRPRRSTASTCGSPAGRSATTTSSSASRSSAVSETREHRRSSRSCSSRRSCSGRLPRRRRDRPAGRGADRASRRASSSSPPTRRTSCGRRSRSSRPRRASPSPASATRRVVPGGVRAGRPRDRSGCAGCSTTCSGWPGSTPSKRPPNVEPVDLAVLAGPDGRSLRRDRRDPPSHARGPRAGRRTRSSPRRPSGSTDCSACCSTTPASTRRTAARVDVTVAIDGSRVALTVDDSGPGIPEAERDADLRPLPPGDRRGRAAPASAWRSPTRSSGRRAAAGRSRARRPGAPGWGVSWTRALA